MIWGGGCLQPASVHGESGDPRLGVCPGWRDERDEEEGVGEPGTHRAVQEPPGGRARARNPRREQGWRGARALALTLQRAAVAWPVAVASEWCGWGSPGAAGGPAARPGRARGEPGEPAAASRVTTPARLSREVRWGRGGRLSGR